MILRAHPNLLIILLPFVCWRVLRAVFVFVLWCVGVVFVVYYLVQSPSTRLCLYHHPYKLFRRVISHLCGNFCMLYVSFSVALVK